MKTYFFHLDTATPGTVKNNYNSFQCVIPLTRIHRDIRRVFLKSAEIPISYKSIHAPLNTFSIDSTLFTIAEGTYTSASIIQELAIAPGVNGSFALNSSGKFVFTSSSGSRTFTSVTPGDVLYSLGFVTGQTGTAIVAQNNYNLGGDTFISIWFKNLYTSSSETPQISFKIPVNATNGVVYYYAENSEFVQYFDVTEPVFSLDRLDIEVHDRFGNILNNNGVDWSFTLAVQTQGT